MGDSDDLIDGLYEAALVPDLWPAVLERMARRVRAWGGLIVHQRDGALRWASTDNNREIAGEVIASGLFDTEFLRRYRAGGHLGFVEDGALFAEEDAGHYDLFARSLAPRGLRHACGAVLLVPNGDAMVFGFERMRNDDPFDVSVIADLDRLRPHIARSALVAGRLSLERARSAVETLSALGLPAAVVNRRLKVRHLNAALAGLEPLVSITAHDRLIIGAPAVENLLAQAVEHVGGSHGGSVRSIPIPATFDRPALVLHVLPITRQANDIFAGSDAMIVATPAVAREGLDVSVLVGCYDLTSAEARVAAAVAAGRTIDEIADASAVSRETVRTHLKRVLSKTGTTRQGELAAMLGPLSAIQPAV